MSLEGFNCRNQDISCVCRHVSRCVCIDVGLHCDDCVCAQKTHVYVQKKRLCLCTWGYKHGTANKFCPSQETSVSVCVCVTLVKCLHILLFWLCLHHTDVTSPLSSRPCIMVLAVLYCVAFKRIIAFLTIGSTVDILEESGCCRDYKCPYSVTVWFPSVACSRNTSSQMLKWHFAAQWYSDLLPFNSVDHSIVSELGSGWVSLGQLWR